MATDTKLKELIINKLTTSQYDSIEEKDPNQLYIVTDAPGFDNTITNCLTKIPQDVKLELNNNSIPVLKAGSKVCVPNGFEADGTTPKFNIITTTQDMILGSAWGNAGTMVLCLQANGSALFMYQKGRDTSGTTPPTETNTQIWYDTNNNLIKNYSGGNDNGGRQSFPIAICTKTTAGDCVIESIDQVFNGFGYIGSTVFVLPGVKGLIPNGRNADGSLQNTEFTTTSVMTESNSGNWNGVLTISRSGKFYMFVSLSYNQETNYNYNSNGIQNCINAGSFSFANGRISSFRPKTTTFHAVDRNDTSWLSGLGMPSDKYIDLTLGATGATYTAPANGYYYTRLVGTSGNYFYLRNRSASNIADGGTLGAKAMDASVRVKKGDEVYLAYNGTITTVEVFRFIYAEGETE